MERLLLFVDWMSDSLGLSHKQAIIGCLVVRFFEVIGQAGQHRQSGCPILRSYRTSRTASTAWMSDSLKLSDKRDSIDSLDVRFFAGIGQAGQHRQSGCPIL